MSWKLNQFDSDRQLVEVLAVEIAGRLQRAIASRDRASLAVSGGKTPVALFQRLAAADIEWDKVSVTLVDERWVPESHPDSNAALVKANLLRGRARYAEFVGLVSDAADPFVAAPQVEKRLASLDLPLDVVVLGMGSDGHTASFFAAARGVETALDPAGGHLCCAVDPTTAPHQRMTLTLPVILAARHCYLHLVGTDKKRVLSQALDTDPVIALADAAATLPIAQVLHRSSAPVQIYYAEHGA